MTTIAASFTGLIVAADSRVTWYDTKTDTVLHSGQSYKLWRTRRFIIGAAGNDDDIADFKHWLQDTSRKRRWSKVDPFEALLLSRTKLYYLSDGSALEEVRLPYHAIGSGASFAMAAMNTQHRLTGEIDPALAVLVACDHDPGTREPIDVARWAPVRARRTAPDPIDPPKEAADGRSPDS